MVVWVILREIIPIENSSSSPVIELADWHKHIDDQVNDVLETEEILFLRTEVIVLSFDRQLKDFYEYVYHQKWDCQDRNDDRVEKRVISGYCLIPASLPKLDHEQGNETEI